jgi:glyoxylase-like metal-dependent hydrolase (beta-lactamase superfamily II)
MPTSRSDDFSRRSFLRSTATFGAAALVARIVPSTLTGVEAMAAMQQAAATQKDPLAAMRAQMGSAPIQSTPLGSGLVMLSGPGGNVVVLHGSEGKIVVDSFLQPAWQSLKSTLDKLPGGAIKTLIDTHWHFDHTDNNANFHQAGATIIAHDNTKKRMTESHDLLGMHFAPSPAAALPTETFSDRQLLRANAEEIAMFFVPPAHTDGDVVVQFRNANVVHMGDVFFNGSYPFIDASTGGNINGMVNAAERALKIINSRTKVVPGHGPLGDRAALDRYRTMLSTVRDTVGKLKGSGQSLEQVQAAKPTADFDETWGKGRMTPNDFVALVYNTL